MGEEKAIDKKKIAWQVKEVIRAIREKKGFDLTVLDVREIASFTDYFIICSGTSTKQTQTISDAVREELERKELSPYHIEGYEYGKWILIDYIDFIVNIFLPETREYYELEKLWADAPRIELDKLEE
ncbi:MAG: ribosome silencing factor [Acidobacteria bacterium]|nr:ribosome silencing factor [Acidobacteriota bacterium]